MSDTTFRYEIDIKWNSGGAIAPVLSNLKVVDYYTLRDEPSGYAYIVFNGTEIEFKELHKKLIASDRFFKVIGIHGGDE